MLMLFWGALALMVGEVAFYLLKMVLEISDPEG
jgi:hypothetical protein